MNNSLITDAGLKLISKGYVDNESSLPFDRIDFVLKELDGQLTIQLVYYFKDTAVFKSAQTTTSTNHTVVCSNFEGCIPVYTRSTVPKS
jgi:hypothetical protein